MPAIIVIRYMLFLNTQIIQNQSHSFEIDIKLIRVLLDIQQVW